MITAWNTTRMTLETASGWSRPRAFQRGSPGKKGRKYASWKHTRSVLVTAFNLVDSFFSFKNQIGTKQYFPKANITKVQYVMSNFQNCHTRPGKQNCGTNRRQAFTKESCQAELRRTGLLNVVGAWCKPVQTAQRTCRVCNWTFWLTKKMKWNEKKFQTHQTVRRSVPYTEKKQVCSRTQLWHVSTPVVYPWSPVIMPFVVRGANLDYCADLGIDELTEEDLEICEVVCQPAKVQECAKVSI